MCDWHLIDLHIHSALSPCAEDEMTPPQVIQRCVEMGLSVIAICDHNSCQNTAAFAAAASGTEITVIPGMELTTSEEVHLLCLFPDQQTADQWDVEVRSALPTIKNRPELFGHQRRLGPSGEILGEVETLLFSACRFSLSQTVKLVEGELGGLVIPAHIDRVSFSLLANLGLPPTDIFFSAMELSQNSSLKNFIERYPLLHEVPLIHSSDAHRLNDLWVTKQSAVYIKKPSFSEVRAALRGEGERRVVTDLLALDI